MVASWDAWEAVNRDLMRYPRMVPSDEFANDKEVIMLPPPRVIGHVTEFPTISD